MGKIDVDTKLTSIKVLANIYQSFKVICIHRGTTLQRVVNRSLYLYLNDQDFRDTIDNVSELDVSGSNF
jgi:hypothetical protein